MAFEPTVPIFFDDKWEEIRVDSAYLWLGIVQKVFSLCERAV